MLAPSEAGTILLHTVKSTREETAEHPVQETSSSFSVPGTPVRERNVSGIAWLKLGKIRAQWLCLIAAFFCQKGLKAIAFISAFFKSEH